MGKRKTELLALSIILIAVIVVLVVLAMHPNKSSTLSPAQVKAAKQQIESNWKRVFAASTPLGTRVSLLEDGSNLKPLIQSEFKALGPQNPSATVAGVSLINAASANVTYTVNLNNQPVLSNQTGKAILQNGTWKVSKATFCQLLSMDGQKPSICRE